MTDRELLDNIEAEFPQLCYGVTVHEHWQNMRNAVLGTDASDKIILCNHELNYWAVCTKCKRTFLDIMCSK